MTQRNIPLYAYVDETGNTGHNLFDEAQPDFYTAALITKGDFDLAFGAMTKAIADRLGVQSLHAGALGFKQLEAVAPEILRIIRLAKAHFFISRVEKRYLLATKVFDTLFDSGENAGVAWHHYNIKPLKLMLVFKLAATIDDATARQFWQCILEPNQQKALAALPKVCEALQANLDTMPDKGAREVLTRGLTWAREHPESIQIHTDRKSARQGHFPNMVAFSNLLEGLEEHSKRVKRLVARITHDEQSEFQKTLAAWHELFSNASPDSIEWVGETYSMQRVVGSEFDVKSDSQSPGIQITDIVLWLYQQFQKGKSLPDECAAILDYVFENGWESDFSFSGVNRMASQEYRAMAEAPLSPEKEMEARTMLAQAEDARLRSMAQYDQDKLPPFRRGPRADALRAQRPALADASMSDEDATK